jgi:MarR family transcriptional regulator for hemolysin
MSHSWSTTAAAAATPEEHLVVLMREVTRGFRSCVDRRLEPMGLSQAQWRPLLMLHKAGEPLTQTELARLLDIEAPSLVRLLDRLGENGWIERRNAAGDRRVRRVFLTAKAQQLIEQIVPVVHSVREQAFVGVSAADIAGCLAMLERVRDNICGQPPES